MISYQLRVVMIAFMALFLQSFQTNAQTTDMASNTFRSSYADSLIHSLSKRYGAVGVAVRVERAGEVLYNKGWGKARLEGEIPVSDSTVFRIGSITKVFTAVAVLQLQEAGKLDIDDPIEQYIPQLKLQYAAGCSPIRIREILTHSSGLVSSLHNGFFSEMENPHAFLLEQVNKMQVVQPQGDLRVYSNVGYALLGVLIEEVSGQSYGDYLREHILDPLDMKHSGVVGDDRMPAHFAYGYADSSTVVPHPIPVRSLAAGIMYSTAHDLSRFNRALYQPGVFSEDLIEQLRGNTKYELSYNGEASLGLYKFAFNTNKDSLIGPFYGHGGDTEYFHSLTTFHPKEELSVVVLSNTKRASLGFYNNVAARLVLHYLKGQYPDLKTGYATASFQFPLLPSDSLTGIYETGGGSFIRIRRKGKKNLVFIQNGKRIRLLRQDNGTYLPKFMILKFIPYRVKGLYFMFDTLNNTPYLGNTSPNGSYEWVTQRKASKRHLEASAFEGFQGKCRVLNTVPGSYGLVPDSVSIREKPFSLELHCHIPDSKETRTWTFYLYDGETAISEGVSRGAWATLRALGDNRYWWSGYEFEVIPEKDTATE